MSGKTEQVKGRVKEAAGALTNDEKLREEGRADQAAGKAKEVVDKVATQSTAATSFARDIAEQI